MTRTLRLGFRVSDNAGLGPVTLKPNTHHPQRGSHVCAECHSVCLGTQRGHVLGTQRGHVLVVMCSWSCAGPRRCVVMCWTAAWSCAGPRQRLGTREDLCLLTRAKGCALCTLWLYFSVSTVYAWTSPVPHSASLEPCAYDWIPILARARPQTLRVWQKSRPTCACPSSVEGRERERNCAITA